MSLRSVAALLLCWLPAAAIAYTSITVLVHRLGAGLRATGLVVAGRLPPDDPLVFADLDHGVEWWCEDTLLARADEATGGGG